MSNEENIKTNGQVAFVGSRLLTADGLPLEAYRNTPSPKGRTYVRPVQGGVAIFDGDPPTGEVFPAPSVAAAPETGSAG